MCSDAAKLAGTRVEIGFMTTPLPMVSVQVEVLVPPSQTTMPLIFTAPPKLTLFGDSIQITPFSTCAVAEAEVRVCFHANIGQHGIRAGIARRRQHFAPAGWLASGTNDANGEVVMTGNDAVEFGITLPATVAPSLSDGVLVFVE